MKKLPLKNKLLMHLRCLSPLNITKPDSLQSLKFLSAHIPFIISPCQVSKLADEWICLQSEDISSFQASGASVSDPDTSDSENDERIKYPKGHRIDNFWNNIFQICSHSGGKKYILLPPLVKALLTLSHGNADCERGFSMNKRMIGSRSNLNISSINGLRQIKSHMKRLNYDINKFQIDRDVLKAVKNARQVYSKRIEEERSLKIKSQKRKASSEKNCLKEKIEEEKELQKQLHSAQILLNMAEKHIEDGLKIKDLNLIEGGQILLKEAKEKIPNLTQKIKENKEEQLKLCKNKCKKN